MESIPGRPGPDSQEPTAAKGDQDTGAYQAVSVSCGQGACVYAESISGVRFLVDEAPRLPLTGCTAERCTCSYFHFRDRRSFLSNRRTTAALEGVTGKRLSARERRQGPNRRKLKILAAGEPS